MDLVVVALTFAAIFVVELPDKTFIATLVMSTKYRPLYVWIGVGAAFLVQTIVAVGFGKAIGLLPEVLVHSVAGLMFFIGAVVLFREARTADAEEPQTEEEFAAKAAGGKELAPARVVVTCFLILFAAEWGDLSQLLTLTLVAKYDDPVSVFIGAWTALLAVSALAAIVGRALLKRVRLSLLHYVGAGVCLLLGLVTAYEILV
jgi:Ca2+/H+ antiporter, TMEM165/GDT1 family